MLPLLLIQITTAPAPLFKPEWAVNNNQYLGQTSVQPVTK